VPSHLAKVVDSLESIVGLGHLIFGRTFAVEDIVAYWIGISLVAVGDEFALRRRGRRSSLLER